MLMHNMNGPIFIQLFISLILAGVQAELPIVLNTWPFTNATIKAWEILNCNHHTALDALVEGCSVCEREQCDGTVGYGGSPDEAGETTLDAMIMDGSNFNVGAIAGLRQIKHAIKVARLVLEHTRHTLLVGESATEFAEMMGFKRESLSSPKSKMMWKNWKLSKCQPNFWMNVLPNPRQHCGPYSPVSAINVNANSIREEYENQCRHNFGQYNHDTIGMIVIDGAGKIFAGTSSNGALHKIHGRVGDSPIPGAGAFADNEVGAATATGDGDVMMRFLPSFKAVENLRNGLSPKDAADDALSRIVKHYPNFVGGLIVSDNRGNYAASCVGIDKFPFSIFKQSSNEVAVEYVNCI